jgi:hypothetical protein
MRDLPCHQKPERFLNPSVIGHIHEALIDDLGTRFRSNIGSQVRSGLANGVDISSCPRNACGIGKRRASAVKECRDMGIVAASRQRALKLGFRLHGLGELALSPLIKHGYDRPNDFQMA